MGRLFLDGLGGAKVFSLQTGRLTDALAVAPAPGGVEASHLGILAAGRLGYEHRFGYHWTVAGYCTGHFDYEVVESTDPAGALTSSQLRSEVLSFDVAFTLLTVGYRW